MWLYWITRTSFVALPLSCSMPTLFPGSLFFASLGHWEKDPDCSWSRDHLWHKLFHQDRVNEQFLSISTEAKERQSLVIATCMLNYSQAYTPFEFSSPIVSFTQVRGNIFIYIQRIEVSLWFQFQPVDLLTTLFLVSHHFGLRSTERAKCHKLTQMRLCVCTRDRYVLRDR